jgi:hypothetical protein
MKRLPNLAYNSDGAFLAERARIRTDAASVLLHEFAIEVRTSGLCLVLHGSLDYFFDFDADSLPSGAVDARSGDAIGHALIHADAVVISLDGIFIGNITAADPRFGVLKSTGRITARLRGSALSGAFFGLSIDGPGIDHELRRPTGPC